MEPDTCVYRHRRRGLLDFMVNIPLVFLVIGGICYGILVRYTPARLREWADIFNARADSEEYFRKRIPEYRRHRAEREKELSESGQNA